MAIDKYFEQNLRLVDYVDGLMIVDNNCIIKHFYTAYPNIVKLTKEDCVGHNLFDVYPKLNKEDSYIYKCLTTGEAFLNYQQTYEDLNGNMMPSVSSAIPIKEQGETVGVIDIVIYLDAHVNERRLSFDMSLISSLKQSYNTSKDSIDDIVTQDPMMINIKKKIVNTDDSDSHVLVYGKTGTGKELIVNAIQKMSNRKNAPFIKQNCASIPSSLLESILFGTTKGSYTGAIDSPGLFELADGGTLFLDEINSMELDAQAKLLRVLEDKKIRRIGGKTEKSVDVRVIAAVNEDPEYCVETNKIREDIYYRLCVLRYDIPELVNRKGDIPLLMEYFRKYYNKKLGKQVIAYSEEVYDVFVKYNWPGNVRELKNVIESCFISNYGAIVNLDDVPNYILSRIEVENIVKSKTFDMSLSEIVEQYEKNYILDVYEKNGYNLTKTANELKVSKQNLAYKINKYQIKKKKLK